MRHDTTSHSRSGAATAAPDSKHKNWRGTQGILCLEGAPVLVLVAIRHLPRDRRDSNTSARA